MDTGFLWDGTSRVLALRAKIIGRFGRVFNRVLAFLGRATAARPTEGCFGLHSASSRSNVQRFRRSTVMETTIAVTIIITNTSFIPMNTAAIIISSLGSGRRGMPGLQSKTLSLDEIPTAIFAKKQANTFRFPSVGSLGYNCPGPILPSVYPRFGKKGTGRFAIPNERRMTRPEKKRIEDLC
jgi:hypothetical protein